MKATGMVRNTDNLGRVVISKEIRRQMSMDENQPLEIFLEDNAVVLKKYQKENTCMVTGKISDQNMTLANGHIVLSPSGVRQLLEEVKQQEQEATSRSIIKEETEDENLLSAKYGR